MAYNETVSFHLKDGVVFDAFLALAFRVDREYQDRQPGYLSGSRRTRRDDNDVWSISVDWETREDSERSQVAFPLAGDLTREFIAAIDADTLTIARAELFLAPADELRVDAGSPPVVAGVQGS